MSTDEKIVFVPQIKCHCIRHKVWYRPRWQRHRLSSPAAHGTCGQRGMWLISSDTSSSDLRVEDLSVVFQTQQHAYTHATLYLQVIRLRRIYQNVLIHTNADVWMYVSHRCYHVCVCQGCASRVQCTACRHALPGPAPFSLIPARLNKAWGGRKQARCCPEEVDVGIVTWTSCVSSAGAIP